MRVVLQRVSEARVTVDGHTVGAIGVGWVALVGVAPADTACDAAHLADKVAKLRALADADGKMNVAVPDVPGAAVLAVSNFTLYADCARGRRPGFAGAAPPAVALPVFEAFVDGLRRLGVRVETGVFGADMHVSLTNSGPVTLVLDAPPT